MNYILFRCHWSCQVIAAKLLKIHNTVKSRVNSEKNGHFQKESSIFFWTPLYHSTFTADYFDKKIFLKNHNFSSKNRVFKKKGLTPFKRRGPPSSNPSQIKEPNLSFLKIPYLTQGKSRKNGGGVLKWDHFSEIPKKLKLKIPKMLSNLHVTLSDLMCPFYELNSTFREEWAWYRLWLY